MFYQEIDFLEANIKLILNLSFFMTTNLKKLIVCILIFLFHIIHRTLSAQIYCVLFKQKKKFMIILCSSGFDCVVTQSSLL
ncbi:hypothetical protein BpHYR1_004421 [Brachionus plicatilis]|uniref:Uncharacterized protein n=1 Tax=Brachionus plicatilis TaxID=10195 RepID=A0A3M7T3S8_BRAPC|nr:hypothetical protein BpHYR1_004421 [Brachionus plicatilis]